MEYVTYDASLPGWWTPKIRNAVGELFGSQSDDPFDRLFYFDGDQEKGCEFAPRDPDDLRIRLQLKTDYNLVDGDWILKDPYRGNGSVLLFTKRTVDAPLLHAVKVGPLFRHLFERKTESETGLKVDINPGLLSTPHTLMMHITETLEEIGLEETLKKIQSAFRSTTGKLELKWITDVIEFPGMDLHRITSNIEYWRGESRYGEFSRPEFLATIAVIDAAQKYLKLEYNHQLYQQDPTHSTKDFLKEKNAQPLIVVGHFC